MLISQEELHELVIDTVRRFAGGGMERRHIRERVESRLRSRTAWEPTDDVWSQSSDPKSIGQATIDWAISTLYSKGRLEKLGRNQWVAAANQPRNVPHTNKVLVSMAQWINKQPEVLERAKTVPDASRIEFMMNEFYSWDLAV